MPISFVEQSSTVPSLTWAEAEAMFPGCGAQWDAQGCDPSPDVILFVNGLNSLTAAWVNERWRDVSKPTFGPMMQKYTLYAWWDVKKQRWVFSA